MVGRPPKILKWSETIPEEVKLFGRPFWRSEVVGRPSQRSESVRETVPKVWNWSGDPPGGTEVVGRPYRRSGSRGETPQ